MPITGVKENDGATGLGGDKAEGLPPSFLASSSISSGDSVPHVPPHTSHPPHTSPCGSAIREPLAENNPRPGHSGDPEHWGMRGLLINSLLCSQAKSHFCTSPPQGRLCTADHTLRPLQMNLQALCFISLGPLTSVLSGTKGSELCLQHANPVGQ